MHTYVLCNTVFIICKDRCLNVHSMSRSDNGMRCLWNTKYALKKTHTHTHIRAPFLPPPTIRQLLPRGPLFPFTTNKTVSSGTEICTSQYVVNTFGFRFLWSCIVSKIWREKTNKMQLNFCLNMFRASLCPSSGEKMPCYCIWCVVLVLLDVAGSGCGALSCRMWARHTKCSNRAFVLLMMGIVMPETCWDRS